MQNSGEATKVVDYSPSEVGQEVAMPSRRCPHCKITSSYPVGAENRLFDRQITTTVRFDICRNEECGCATVVVFKPSEGNKIVDEYPNLETEPDELLPNDVKIAFRQALQSLNEKIWDGCVTMAGRALEEAMADLKAEGKTLYKKIEFLAGKNTITPDLREWAHEGRLGRNLGAHGSERQKWSDESDAEEIVEFCKWFFRYVYILPKQLEQRRQRLAEGAKLAEEAATEEES